MADRLRDRREEVLALAPPMEVPFPLHEYARRRGALRQALADAEIDMVFLSSPEAICWLTGDQAGWYQSQSTSSWPPASGVAVHVDHDVPIHFESDYLRPRLAYTSVSIDVRTVPAFAVTPGGDLLDLVVATLRDEGWLRATVGLELGSYRPNPNVSARFRAALGEAGAHVVDATAVTREVRRLKSPLERDAVRMAYRVGEIGLRAVVDAIAPGMTELEVYAELVAAMARAGGEVPGITLPILSGAKTLSGDALASRKVIMPGEIVTVDICGVMYRYHANLARTLSMGEPSEAVRRQVDGAAGAFAVAAKEIGPGVELNAFVGALEAYYRDAGVWEDRWFFGGYELGIAFPPDWVGEWTWQCGRDHGDAFFEPGLVVNYESNVVLPERAGRAMLINTLIVEDDRAEVLTTGDSALIVVD